MDLTLADLQRQLNELTSAFKALEARVAGLSLTPAARPGAVSAASAEVARPAAKAAAHSKVPLEVTPEILVVIAAAATKFLGKNVRIRSANILQTPYEIINPWSQQGRVFVQASHNLRSRG